MGPSLVVYRYTVISRGSAARTGGAAAVPLLAAACFTSVTAENAPIALLPVMSHDLHSSPAAVGGLMTGYALVVALTAVPATALTGRWDRRTAVVGSVATIAVSTLLTTVSPSVPVIAAARCLAAVGHGVFWSVVASLAARLSPPERAGRATATVFAGNSVAFVAGVPATSALGATVGWRAAFAVLAALAAVVTAALARWVPRVPPEPNPHVGGNPLRALRQRGPALVTLATLLIVLGNFCAFTYVTELVRHWTGWSGTRVSLVLLGNGVLGAIAVGTVRGPVDHRPRRTALAVVLGLAGIALALLVLAGSAVPVAVLLVVLWAAPSACIATVLQTGVLRAARSGTAELASSGYVVAFQIGIAGGALAGGLLADHGALSWTPAVTAGCAVLAVPAIVAARTAFPRRRRAEPVVRAGRAVGEAGHAPGG